MLVTVGTIFGLLLATVSADVVISPDTPINQLISSAKAARARGATSDALSYFDAAIARDGSDYLARFQRGATYLAAGRNAQAKADFDSVLRLRPDFDGALLQRAKISARSADWAAARHDYKAAGAKATAELASLNEAEGAAYLAAEAEKKGDWEACVNNAGIAIMTAAAAASLRQVRAHCRFEQGEVQMGVSDLQHVLQLNPSAVEPHLQIAAMQFYILGDTDAGLGSIKRCLHADPESKPCKALFREMKTLSKSLDRVSSLMDTRKYTAAVKLLVEHGPDPTNPDLTQPQPGILSQIKSNMAAHTPAYILSPSTATPSALYTTFLTHTCSAYQSISAPKRAAPYCSELLQLSPTSLPALLFEGQEHLDAGNYEAAIHSYRSALDHHPSARDTIHPKLQDAQVQLKRSKTKDYYKVLDLPRTASEREIKSAYRRMTKLHHPDKARANGDISREEAEKKMAAINEAYEVLSDPELRQRYDNGDDPNDPMARQGGSPFEGATPFGFPAGGGGGQQFFFQQGGFPGFG
ncbi:hypothetical protein DV736_g3103, partial [Chaetothyriales sp. CBS 134916]